MIGKKKSFIKKKCNIGKKGTNGFRIYYTVFIFKPVKSS